MSKLYIMNDTICIQGCETDDVKVIVFNYDDDSNVVFTAKSFIESITEQGVYAESIEYTQYSGDVFVIVLLKTGGAYTIKNISCRIENIESVVEAEDMLDYIKDDVLPSEFVGYDVYKAWDFSTFYDSSSYLNLNIECESTATVAKIVYSHINGEDNFSVSPDSPQELESGQSVEFTVTPDEGYHIESDGYVVVNGNTIQLSDNKFIVEFSQLKLDADNNIDFYIISVADETPPSSGYRTKFYTVYKPSDENMSVINNAYFFEGGQFIGSDLNDFSSYKHFYVDIVATGSADLRAGGKNFGVKAPVVEYTVATYDCGCVFVDEKWRSLLDYSPFSRLTLYLPFIGFVEVDDKKVIGRELKIDYVVDILSGRCLARLWSKFIEGGEDFTCFAQYNGTIASDEIFGNVTNEYFGTYELMTSNQLGELKAYLIVSTSPSLEGDLSSLKGYPTNEIVKVGDVEGFVQYDSIDVKGIGCSEQELRLIENVLLSGVLVN